MLNRQYRGVDRTTDVLSFPQSSDIPIHASRFTAGEFMLGDIVINLHKAKRQSEEYGISFGEELKRLLVHGLVHLIGYDHEKSWYQKIRMETKERELRALLMS